VPPALLAELRRLRDVVWPDIRDSVAVNECKTFGHKLEKLALQWKCAPLAEYAVTLLTHADQYAVSDLEAHLLRFGEFVDQLDPVAT
jgi:hypothetical protein